MTQCKIHFLSGNTVEGIVKEILIEAGFSCDILGRDGLGWKFEIKNAGADLTSTEKNTIKATAQDLGLYLRWM